MMLAIVVCVTIILTSDGSESQDEQWQKQLHDVAPNLKDKENFA